MFLAQTLAMDRWRNCVLWLGILHWSLCTGSVQITNPRSYKLTVPFGESISVECESESGGNVQWIHKGRPVSQTGRYTVGQTQYHRHAPKKSILTLSDVTEEDSGLITCMDGTNHAHTDDVILHVNQANNSPVVEIIEPATESISVTVGSDVAFKCINRHGKHLKWYLNGTPLDSSTHIITEAMSLDGTRINLLSPRRVSKSDEGMYTCEEVGNPPHSENVKVTVEESSHGTAHVDIVEPSVSHITLREGTPLQLKCTADIETEIGWRKDNVHLQNGADGYVITEGTESSFKTSVLSRQEVIMEQATYTCVNEGDTSETDQVNVDYGDNSHTGEYTPPHQEDRVLIRMQSSVSLQCLMNARGDYEVVWSKGRRHLEASDKYSISRRVDISTLTIRNTDQHDIGQYQCSFINKDTGKTAGSVLYNVSGVRCPPINVPANGFALNCPQTAYVGDTCTIQCNSHSVNMVGTTVSVCEGDETTSRAHWTDTGVHCKAPVMVADEERVPYSMSPVLLRAHELTRLKCEKIGPWMKGNRTLQNDDKYLLVNDTLVIKDTGKEDSGEYTCVLYDNKRILYAYMKFNVTYMSCRPLQLPKHVYATDCSESPIYGETCEFHCQDGFHMHGSQFSTCELLTPTETGTYWTSEPPQCTDRGHTGEHFGQESHAHSDLHLSYLSHVTTLACVQILYLNLLSGT